MAIDTKRCSACNNCSITCKVENNLPDGMWWSTARTEGGDHRYVPGGTYPDNLYMTYYTMSCQHCDNPACVSVCPTTATYRRTEDGIVATDYAECIGCLLCVEACPYDVRVYLDAPPEFQLDFAVGDADVEPIPELVATKCTFCVHRIDRGELPVCIEICQAQARCFGDFDDPGSDLSKLLASREHYQLLTEKGTSPNLYYLT
ncbi:MAG: 4Fe-4S dicluster domain-containing protein [Eggerthellaceae bacterium]|jgi:molybdopterin-containing oxidoreductase family iron-sulfur binding subunit|nr:4Fe-4S dicluster domain-containing protein [Eggerthellaceae bacterium]